MTVPLHRLADRLSEYMKCVPPPEMGIHYSVILLLRYGLNDSFLSSAHFTQLKPTAVTPAVHPIKRFPFQEVKVKWSRYRPGVAQRVGRGIALLLHDRSTRRGWVVSSTPRPHFTPGKDPVPIVQEAGWAAGPVWTGGNLVSTGIRSRTVQPVVSRYTNWATRPTFSRSRGCKFRSEIVNNVTWSPKFNLKN